MQVSEVDRERDRPRRVTPGMPEPPYFLNSLLQIPFYRSQ